MRALPPRARPDRPGLVNVSRLRSRAAAPRASRRAAPPHHPENAMTDIDPHELVGRYVAVWNQAAAGLGFPAPILEARGHDELEVRVTRAYEEFVAPGNFTFQPQDNADRLGNVVKFTWEMVPSDGGAAAGAGLEVLVLDEDGRIKTDYQFIEP